MSKINIVVESLKTTNYLVAAAAVAGTVLMPIPSARAQSAGIKAAATTVTLPVSKPTHRRAGANAPLDLAAVARMAPPHTVARAQELAARDTIGILTKDQIVAFAKSNPAFVAKLQQAYLTGTEPQLTAEERQILAAFSAEALGDMRAGNAPSISSCADIGTCTPNEGTNKALAGFAALFFLLLLLILLYDIGFFSEETAKAYGIPGARE